MGFDTDFQLVKQRARYKVSITLGLTAERQSGGRGTADVLFTRVRGMRGRIIMGEHRHGGSALPFKWPRGVTFDNVTLAAGATQSPDLVSLFAESAEAAAGIADLSALKRPAAIWELDRTGEIINEWVLNNAWAVEWTPGDYDSASDRFLIERLVLAHDGITPGQSSRRVTVNADGTQQIRRARVPDISSIMSRIL